VADRPSLPRGLRPQLEMVRPSLDDLPPLAVPPPYVLRTYREGDEAAWAEIMNTGIGEGWTAERCQEFLIRPPQFRPDGLFFAARPAAGGEVVAGTTCAWRPTPEECRTGIVHMVCVRPEERGHRLGCWLTLAALHYFRDHGFARARLSTDDYRLSAIRAYLDLGFVPTMTDLSHPARWMAVREALSEEDRQRK
jgi:mycothiol synthase